MRCPRCGYTLVGWVPCPQCIKAQRAETRKRRKTRAKSKAARKARRRNRK